MAGLLNEATDSWSFDKLIQPLSNPDKLEELLKYLNAKHATHHHEHIDAVALTRILITIKFVSSKKKLFNTLKPSIDQLIGLCHDILSTLERDNKLTKTAPWLWLRTILAFFDDNNNDNNGNRRYPYFDVNRVSQKINESLQFQNDNNNNNLLSNNDRELPQFLFPEWCFATKSGIKIFEDNFKNELNENENNVMSEDDDDSDDSDDDDLFGEKEYTKKQKKQKPTNDDKKKMDIDDELKPKSRTLSNVKFLSFPRPNPPQNSTVSSNSSSLIQEAMTMRKRQKITASSFASIGSNETDRKRKLSAINDKLNRMMKKKNEKKNAIRLLSIQQKRQMREDSDRREQERKYQIEQTRLEKERIKKLEKERQEREEKEKQISSLINNEVLINNNNDDLDELDDFDAFMNDIDGDDNDKNKNDIKTEKKNDGIPDLNGPDLNGPDLNGPAALSLTLDDNNNNNDIKPLIPELTTPDITTTTNKTINDDNDNKKMIHNASSSDDESLADMLVAPGEETKKPKKEEKQDVKQEQKEIVHTQKELEHYKKNYPKYYKQYMDKQNAKNNHNNSNNNNIDPEQSRLLQMGIPIQLQKYKWLYENCSMLTQENRLKIVGFMTGKYTKEGVEKEDIVLNRTIDTAKGVAKDNVFRMIFADKKWKKVVLSRKLKKKT